MDDLIAWHFNNNGQFSVRSAYKVFMSHKRRCTMNRGRGDWTSRTANQVDHPLWRRMWSLSCSKKMIHCLWWLGHNTLALRVNLRRRGMKIETKCVICEGVDEDGGHFFFKCKWVRHIWVILQLDQIKETLAEMLSAREVVEVILKSNLDITKSDNLTLSLVIWKMWCKKRRASKKWWTFGTSDKLLCSRMVNHQAGWGCW